MRCGTKCFLVEMEENGEKKVQPVIARTPAEARKQIRYQYGVGIRILSVTLDKKSTN